MAAVVASSSGVSGATGTLAATKPSGSAAGDLLLAFHAADWDTAALMTAPSGWTLVPGGSFDLGSNNLHMKVWQADGAVAGSTFSNGTSSDAAVVIARITGQDAAATPIVAANGNATATTSFNAPSVTPAAADDLLVCGVAGESIAAPQFTWTEPGSMTHVNQAASGAFTNVDVASEALASSAATGTRTFGTSQTVKWCALTVAVKSASAPPTTAAPVTDITTTGWTFTGGASASAVMGETVASDAEYATSPTAPSSSVLEVKFASVPNPGVTTGHSVSYRIAAPNSSTSTVVAALYQGTTLIATETRTNVPTTFTTYTLTLTSGQAATITDYSDLRLRLTATAS